MGAALLVVTNVFLIPAIVYSAMRRMPVDATILSMLLLASTLYHACQAEYFCETSLSDHRLADHSFVYITLTWLFLSMASGVRMDVRYSILLGIIFILIFFNERLFQSFAFAGILLATFVLYALVGLFWIGLPLRRFDVIFGLIILVLFGAGFALHLVGSDPDSANYWWAHSLWHVFAMCAIVLFLIMRDNFYILGLHHEFAPWKRRGPRLGSSPYTWERGDPRFFAWHLKHPPPDHQPHVRHAAMPPRKSPVRQ